ncbi:hypothetical protein E4U41_001259 [Claviceps citrina]|nr:hypothetical protein E4U41_001259 [Claviceps citrina]
MPADAPPAALAISTPQPSVRVNHRGPRLQCCQQPAPIRSAQAWWSTPSPRVPGAAAPPPFAPVQQLLDQPTIISMTDKFPLGPVDQQAVRLMMSTDTVHLARPGLCRSQPFATWHCWQAPVATHFVHLVGLRRAGPHNGSEHVRKLHLEPWNH